MAKGNFKVMCTDDGGFKHFYTVGKIYEIKDGAFTYDDGDTEPLNDTLDDFVNLRKGMFIQVPDCALMNKPLSHYSVREIAEELLRRYDNEAEE